MPAKPGRSRVMSQNEPKEVLCGFAEKSAWAGRLGTVQLITLQFIHEENEFKCGLVL